MLKGGEPSDGCESMERLAVCVGSWSMVGLVSAIRFDHGNRDDCDWSEERMDVDPLGLRPRLSGQDRDRAIEMSMAIKNVEVPEPWAFRHPGTRHFAPLFETNHLPPHLQEISAPFAALALSLLSVCHDGPELSAALRKLLEAKDCAVRQRVLDTRSAQ